MSAKTKSVRAGELRCSACQGWKPDDAFSRNADESVLRRGRHHECTACQTAAKRAYRERQKAAGFPGRRHGTSALYGDGCRCRQCLDAELVRRKAALYREKMPGAALTPMALAKWWADLDGLPAGRSRGGGLSAAEIEALR